LTSFCKRLLFSVLAARQDTQIGKMKLEN